MSTTERKLFSYDREEDADIHDLFEELPKRQHSKYIRIALRLLHEKLNKGDILTDKRTASISPSESKKEPKKKDAAFEDLSDDILNMGK